MVQETELLWLYRVSGEARFADDARLARPAHPMPSFEFQVSCFKFGLTIEMEVGCVEDAAPLESDDLMSARSVDCPEMMSVRSWLSNPSTFVSRLIRKSPNPYSLERI